MSGEWRRWAQFVFGGGGPVPDGATDAALRAMICAEMDASVADAKQQRQHVADLLAALKALLADIEDYQRINHLGGESNQSQVLARAAIAKAEGA